MKREHSIRIRLSKEELEAARGLARHYKSVSHWFRALLKLEPAEQPTTATEKAMKALPPVDTPEQPANTLCNVGTVATAPVVVKERMSRAEISKMIAKTQRSK